MGTSDDLDPLVFGQRLRHLRRRSGMTLDALSQAVGRPPSYLSQLENGHREPRLSTVNQLAAALGCRPADLLEASSPEPQGRAGSDAWRTCRQIRCTRRCSCRTSVRAPALTPPPWNTWSPCSTGSENSRRRRRRRQRRRRPRVTPSIGARAANAAMRDEMRKRDNYFEEIESERPPVLSAAVGYSGPGALSERNLTDVASYFGFTIARVQDLPPSTRSISDVRHRVIYVPQRNAAGGMRSARSVIAQTFGHFALDHKDPVDFESYVRQRVEANYFAGALLAPEAAVVQVLGEAKGREDISVEDLNEIFYISYEMAAHRLTNLITRHFGIRVHFQRSDREGVLWKAYENDGVLLPADSDGTIEGQKLCRWWSSRQAYDSDVSYALHYQYTETVTGTFWCVTRIDLDRDHGDAVTVGTGGGGGPLVPRLRYEATGRLDVPRPGVLPAPGVLTPWPAGKRWPGRRRGTTAISCRAFLPTRSGSARTLASTSATFTASLTAAPQTSAVNNSGREGSVSHVGTRRLHAGRVFFVAHRWRCLQVARAGHYPVGPVVPPRVGRLFGVRQPLVRVRR